MDNFIDNPETQKYGPALRSNVTAAFAKSPKPVKTFVAWLVQQQAAADKAMAGGMTKARGTKSALSAAANAMSPETEAARKLLVGFHKHLGSKRALGEWKGDVKLFFPKGLSGIGTSTVQVKDALATALTGFTHDKQVPEGAAMKKKLTAAKKKLDGHATVTSDAIAAARKGLSEQSAEKKGWLQCYRGIALIAEGLLTMEGRAQETAGVVPHRAASGGPKKAKPAAKKKATGNGTKKVEQTATP